MYKSKEQEAHFAQLIDNAVIKQAQRTRYIRALNYIFSISILLLSGVLTVMLGLNFSDNNKIIIMKNSALIIGATITFLSGVKSFWRLEIYWIRRKITLRRLEDLRDEFDFEKLSNEPFDLNQIFQKYQAIQSYSTIYWEDVYNEARTENKPKSGVATNNK